MEKALELFAKQGFEATSVQQITEHCGIAKGAFYLSFKSKRELIVALIDQFMKQLIEEFDYLVKNTNKNRLLYEFYLTAYRFFQQHADFATLFIKEAQGFEQELIEKMHYYDQIYDDIILKMIEHLYGKSVLAKRYDLLYSIKSFMTVYSEFILFKKIELDFDLLSQSLVQKTDLLATANILPFITETDVKKFHFYRGKVTTKEEIIETIQQTIKEMQDSIEKDSLILLQEHLQKEHLAPAIVAGLLENIRKHPSCKWIAFLIRNEL